MKAWLLHDFSGLDRLQCAQVPEPVAERGEAVLELSHAALNPADRYLAEGQYPAKPPLPHILGRDGVGKVISVGPDVNGLRAGDERLILRGEIGVSRNGTFAERVSAAVESLTPLPTGWTPQQAAAGPLVYLTAWQALTQWGPLSPPKVILISGASGGVGVAALQLASAMGHTVIALSRSQEKRARLKSIGAALALDPGHDDWVKQAREGADGRRVDLVVDNIAGPLFPRLIESLGDQGKVSVVGRLAGTVPEFNTASLFFRRLRIGGVAVGAYTPAESQIAWKQVLETLAATNARPLIDRVFPFDELPQAFDRLKQGPMGKVLLDIRSAR